MRSYVRTRAAAKLGTKAALFLFMAAIGILGQGRNANALPSFARQTGQQCAACHNGFPELTPYGRLFKLNGYTFGGGTSPYPPFAGMAIFDFTHTQGNVQGGTPHFSDNNNPSFNTGSLFYGGAVLPNLTPNLGAFIQVTYDGVGRDFHWDNTDIRYATTAQLFDAETIFGVSINNNPTVTDPWNTTPAWAFPFQISGLAPTPAAATMIENEFTQIVAGATAYAYWNRLVYVEFGGYSTLSPKTQQAFGESDVFTNPVIDGIAPYWRLALNQEWGRNSFEVGTFGMTAAITPMRIFGFGRDNVTDVGFDSQYQFLADRDSFSLQASIILENQSLAASSNPAIGAAANSHNALRSMHIKGTYFYDQTYGLTLGAFHVAGTPDAILFANPINNSPNSTGIIGELDYIPFNHGGPSFWPWLNMKLGLQYIYYPEFNGQTGSAATANNTLYTYAWLDF
jgi:hypothetical protein